ncbi:unnamed protein product [Arabis nemorensis]|uniref:Uncharacterized protein n=1 Tax=Arabis nemorensis TaxID=586526 RepID=A0A565CNX7_9BRAS|nr:unnamed protein product [Arabis nemorensis]
MILSLNHQRQDTRRLRDVPEESERITVVQGLRRTVGATAEPKEFHRASPLEREQARAAGVSHFGSNGCLIPKVEFVDPVGNRLGLQDAKAHSTARVRETGLGQRSGNGSRGGCCISKAKRKRKQEEKKTRDLYKEEDFFEIIITVITSQWSLGSRVSHEKYQHVTGNSLIACVLTFCKSTQKIESLRRQLSQLPRVE